LSQALLGKRVAHFVAHQWHPLRSGTTLNSFFPPARAGPGAGLCMARRYVASGELVRGVPRGVSDGQWEADVYAVAGSVAPLAEPWPQKYRDRLEAACAGRRDQHMWFSSAPQSAYLAARLADAVVASARRPGELPFELICQSFPPDMPLLPRCAQDVRTSVSSIDPRAMISVSECDGEPASRCIAVELAQSPGKESDREHITGRWGLNIYFRDPNDPGIARVELADDQVIID
jgi:hypothetical protein